MKTEVFANETCAAQAAAKAIAAEARSAVADRGRFVMAVSGGRTPWIMLRTLAEKELPWDRIHIVQVDERVAPRGDKNRNLTHPQQSLLDHPAIPSEHLHAMPVESSHWESERLGNMPRSLPRSLAHLRHSIWSISALGPDGRTASLVPGDPVLNVTAVDVALTGVYQGRRRMTLTYPNINRARKLLWLVTGSEKAVALLRLLQSDLMVPPGRICRLRAVIFADRAATGDPTTLTLNQGTP